MNVVYYLTTMAIYTCINGILALGLNMQFGVAGILNLAYIVLVAAGAYCTGIAALPPAPAAGQVHYIGGFNWPFPWDVLFGMAVTTAFALLIGLICFRRIASWYLALTLSSIGWALLILVSNDVNLFNGQTGLIAIPGPWQDQLSPTAYQFVVLAMCLVALIVVFVVFWRIEHSPLGRAFRSLREDELAASSLGKDPLRLRLTAYLLGAAAAGLGGGLAAIYFGGWNASAWQPGETFIILAAVIVGGRGRSLGAVLGSVVVLDVFVEGSRFLPEIGGRTDLLPAIQGIAISLLLMAVLWWRPYGLWPERKERFRFRAGGGTEPRPAAGVPSAAVTGDS